MKQRDGAALTAAVPVVWVARWWSPALCSAASLPGSTSRVPLSNWTLSWVCEAANLPPESSPAVILLGRMENDSLLNPLPEKCHLLIHLQCISAQKSHQSQAEAARNCSYALRLLQCAICIPAHQMQASVPGTFSLVPLLSFSSTHTSS